MRTYVHSRSRRVYLHRDRDAELKACEYVSRVSAAARLIYRRRKHVTVLLRRRVFAAIRDSSLR